ncbi:MAG: hypothetical protein WD036_12595 [Bauldia sp.]
MSLTASLRVKFEAAQVGAADFGGPESNPILERLLKFASGGGADQADQVWSDRRTLAASTPEDLDLAGGLTDAFGNVITMAEVVALGVFASEDNTNDVVVGDAAAPVPVFAGTNPTFSVKPGGCIVVAAPKAAGLFTVGAGSTDDLKIANSGAGTSVTYDIFVLGRSA